MIPPMQDQLTAQIAADLGITGVTAEEQQEIISQFGEIALQAATMSVLEKLADPKKEAFMKLAEAGDPSAVQTFLDAEVPGHEEIARAAVAEEIKRFKEASAA